MRTLPKAVSQLIDSFEQLPGVGPKSAQRLVFYLLHNSDARLQEFADRLIALKRDTVLCSKCHNVSDHDPCAICSDSGRDKSVLCIVEQPLDVLAIERSGKFDGLYHVMHGVISPLNNIGPDQIYLRDVLKRLEGIDELIMATNPNMEGEATALYIRELIEQSPPSNVDPAQLKITRLGHGLPVGADIEYADGITIARALEGRQRL